MVSFTQHKKKIKNKVENNISTTGPEVHRGEVSFNVSPMIEGIDRKAIFCCRSSTPKIKRGIIIIRTCEPKESAALLMPHAHHQDHREALAYWHPPHDESLPIFNRIHLEVPDRTIQ